MDIHALASRRRRKQPAIPPALKPIPTEDDDTKGDDNPDHGSGIYFTASMNATVSFSTFSSAFRASPAPSQDIFLASSFLVRTLHIITTGFTGPIPDYQIFAPGHSAGGEIIEAPVRILIMEIRAVEKHQGIAHRRAAAQFRHETRRQPSMRGIPWQSSSRDERKRRDKKLNPIAYFCHLTPRKDIRNDPIALLSVTSVTSNEKFTRTVSEQEKTEQSKASHIFHQIPPPQFLSLRYSAPLR